MAPADIINGAFEVGGGLAVLGHCRALIRDKKVAGVSKLSNALFFAWGIWNLYFYPSLDQWASFAGGLVIVAGNLVWLALALHYTRSAEQ